MAMPPFLQAAMGQSIANLPPDARTLVAFGAGLRELSQLFGTKRAQGAEPNARALSEGALGPLDLMMILSRLQAGQSSRVGPAGAMPVPLPTPGLPMAGLMGTPTPAGPALPSPTLPGAGLNPMALAFQRMLTGTQGIV